MEDKITLSESEEMYLVSIARLLENGMDAPIPIALLAGEMEIAAVSANQMVRKLEESDLVRYYPYKGVCLTRHGEAAALRVLRHRRLWEVFLVEKLHYSPIEAEQLACRVEHVFPDEAAERLADYLGCPHNSPRGKPIPSSGETAQLDRDIQLSQLAAGQAGLVRKVAASPETRAFLASLGISAGETVTVLGASRNGDMLLEASQDSVHLAAGLVKAIWIQDAGEAIHPVEKGQQQSV